MSKHNAQIQHVPMIQARARGELLSCECCFMDELLFREAVQCEDGHVFCRPCIREAAEVWLSEGKTSMACFADCDKDFSLQSMQSALKPAVFLKLEQLRYAEEVQAADIEEFETCPFCNVGASLPVTSNVFECVNPECRKKSCRLCRRVSHTPLRCEEVEEDVEVKARTAIEDKMTEALVRTCVKCKKKIVKAEGCNRLTCTCGASMCYLCRKPVNNYKHFNGQGGQHPERCALFSNDDLVHIQPVLAAAERAKADLAKQNPELKLKSDPAKNFLQPSVPRPGPFVFGPGQPVPRPGPFVFRPDHFVFRPNPPVPRPGQAVPRPNPPVPRPGQPVPRPGPFVFRPDHFVFRPVPPVRRPNPPVPRPGPTVRRPNPPVPSRAPRNVAPRRTVIRNVPVPRRQAINVPVPPRQAINVPAPPRQAINVPAPPRQNVPVPQGQPGTGQNANWNNGGPFDQHSNKNSWWNLPWPFN